MTKEQKEPHAKEACFVGALWAKCCLFMFVAAALLVPATLLYSLSL